MKIVIVGCGNVGTALAEQLSSEGHNITIIDEKETIVNNIANTYDVMGIVGNGAVYSVQMEAGVDEADPAAATPLREYPIRSTTRKSPILKRNWDSLWLLTRNMRLHPKSQDSLSSLPP